MKFFISIPVCCAQINPFLLMCLNHWWVFISRLHAPGVGRQTEPAHGIYKADTGALSGALRCLHFESRLQCAYLWLIYALRWVLWYLIEITLRYSRLHKQERIVNKLHNWIPEVSRVVKIYKHLIRVQICGTGLTLLNASFDTVNCVEPPLQMAFCTSFFWQGRRNSGACLVMTQYLCVIGNIKLLWKPWTILVMPARGYEDVTSPGLEFLLALGPTSVGCGHSSNGVPSVILHQALYESVI